MAKPRLKVIPLGGLSEIGKNMMVMEYGDDIIPLLSCAMNFANALVGEEHCHGIAPQGHNHLGAN